MESWSGWEDGTEERRPQTVQEHIDFYRRSQQAAKRRRSESESEPQPDFFQVTPLIYEVFFFKHNLFFKYKVKIQNNYSS